MSSKMMKKLLFLVLISSAAMAEQIIVLYRPGFPDTTAPAQIFERKLNAAMVSCLDGATLSKVAEEGGYTKIISFDTFLEPHKISELKEKLLNLDQTTVLTIFIKQGDTAYDDLQCNEKNTVDFKSGSYLLPVMKQAGLKSTEGAVLLDNGLSHNQSVDGKALRELYSTRLCSADTLFEIIEADRESLESLISTGKNFVEKLRSQTAILIKEAKVQTLSENGLKIAFQIAATGISTLGPALVSSYDADVALILTESDPFSINGENRYSIRCKEAYSARKIVDTLKKHVDVIRGGGDDVGAGLTCKANAQQVITALRLINAHDIAR